MRIVACAELEEVRAHLCAGAELVDDEILVPVILHDVADAREDCGDCARGVAATEHVAAHVGADDTLVVGERHVGCVDGGPYKKGGLQFNFFRPSFSAGCEG